MDNLIVLITDYGVKILVAILIFLIGKWLAKLVTSFMRKALEKRQTEAALTSFLCSLTNGLILVMVVLTALGTVGVQTTTFAAVIAAAGLAIGLSLQGSLSNLASGVLIILFKPFKVGDFIQTGSTTGIVVDVGMLFSTLKTPDNKKIIAPNSALMGGVITNFSANDERRIDLVYGVSYSADLNHVIAVLNELVADDERILKEPAPTIGVLEHGDSSINIAVRPWVKKEVYWDVFFDMQKKVKERFDAEGISIPFPQRDIHIVEDLSKSASA